MISVIIPVYNAARWLDLCVDSTRTQTFGDIEIILVDDGSTDGSSAICDAHAARDERVRVIHKPNGGVSAARNDALDAARGEWIMFVDADDWIDADTCERAMHAALECRVDIVLWGYMREFADGRHSPRRLAVGDTEFSGEAMHTLHRRVVGPVDDELRDPALLHSWGTVWGKLYRRDVIGGVRFVDTRKVGSAEDALFNVEVMGRARCATYLDRPMYHYRKSEGSVTGGYNPRLEEGWVRLHKLMERAIAERGDDFVRALDNRIALGLIGQSLNELRSPRRYSGKVAAIRTIISTGRYRAAIGALPSGRLPIHWRMFFGAARSGRAATVLFLARLMDGLRRHKKIS
jgi:glycosyltransferase EpsH